MVLGQLSPRKITRPNSNPNPKPNPNPSRRGATFLGGNCPDTLTNNLM